MAIYFVYIYFGHWFRIIIVWASRLQLVNMKSPCNTQSQFRPNHQKELKRFCMTFKVRGKKSEFLSLSSSSLFLFSVSIFSLQNYFTLYFLYLDHFSLILHVFLSMIDPIKNFHPVILIWHYWSESWFMIVGQHVDTYISWPDLDFTRFDHLWFLLNYLYTS